MSDQLPIPDKETLRKIQEFSRQELEKLDAIVTELIREDEPREEQSSAKSK